MAGAPTQQAGGGGGKDNHMGFLWILFGLFIFAAIIWYLFRAQLVQAFFYFKLAEIRIIDVFTNQLMPVQAWIKQADPKLVTAGQLTVIAGAVGHYIRIPGAIVLIALGAFVYCTDIRLKFKKTYSMESLAQAEKGNWPQITPVVDLDLIDQDIDEGQWAMALTPLQFVKKYQLIILHQTKSEYQYKTGQLPPTMELVENKANAAFVAQMGRPWLGIDHLPEHAKALFAVFAAKIDRDSAAANALLNQIALSSKTGTLDFSGVKPLLAKHRKHQSVLAVVRSHAYELGVMASMLSAARDDGVLASAEFLWLKPLDRRLWFMLNNVGRRTAFCEVAGPFSHWLAEKTMGRKLRTPMITQATRGLKIALETIIYTDDDKQATPSDLLPEEEQSTALSIEGETT